MAKIHLGIGHYGIGFRDGVNTVIARNVRALSAIDPDMRITLFGKLAPDHEDFLKPLPANVDFREIVEFDVNEAAKSIGGKSIFEQQVHDYVWLGTNLAEVLVQKLSDLLRIQVQCLHWFHSNVMDMCMESISLVLRQTCRMTRDITWPRKWLI